MQQDTKSDGVLSNKKVLIMGGSSGIGFAIAQAAAAEGAKLIIASSNPIRINHALAQLPADTKGYAVDLSKEEEIKAFFEKTEEIDHLVYTAGENIMLSELGNTEIQEAKDYFNIRYWGAVAAVKYATPLLNKNGSIVLTSGIASQRPGKGWWIGSSICSAMEGFARSMSIDLAPIRVNIVSPGIVETNLWNSINEEDRKSMYQFYAEKLPVQRIGQAEDIAKTYLYCMTQPYGTGQVITVDGGGVLI